MIFSILGSICYFVGMVRGVVTSHYGEMLVWFIIAVYLCMLGVM